MRLLFFLAIVCCSHVGCSEHEAGVETHPVSGTVTYAGKPAEGVVLTFFAEEGDGVNAQAVSDSTGTFVVHTMFDMGRKEQPGMVAGKYRVTASKLEAPVFGESTAPPKNLLPQKYSKPETTTLTATVDAGEQTQLNLDLK